ncbi:MAG: N-acetylmuramoyl-L-alanine amidase [Granulosicoccus sp.]
MKVVFSRRRQLVFLLGGGLLTGPAGLLQASTQLSGFRMVQQETVKLHFDLDQVATGARLFTLADPERLVIDLPNTTLAGTFGTTHYDEGVVASIRYGLHDGQKLRIVVDLRRSVEPAFRFVPRQGGQRLLVDLGVKGNPALAKSRHRLVESSPLRDVVVAIDAGHGGEDSGAVGQRDTYEKDVTLKIAQQLYRQLAAVPGISPVMIRKDDTYIALRERIKLARQHEADLFVSIHADAFKRLAAKGSSVYALSLDGASSEAAEWLAESENKADALFGDVMLDGLEESLRQTLLDLAQNSTMESSMDLGGEVLAQLKAIGSVHKPRVEQAAFAVLKSPDIPSILIETAFISNLEEERKLNDPQFQEQLAFAIGSGVYRFLLRRAPAGTLLAQQRHRSG